MITQTQLHTLTPGSHPVQPLPDLLAAELEGQGPCLIKVMMKGKVFLIYFLLRFILQVMVE